MNEIFRMYMDEPSRAKSIEKIMPIINEIKAVKSIAELNSLAAKYYAVVYLANFYDIAVVSDAKADATKWCAIALPGDFMLGSRDYYTDDPGLVPIHEALKDYIAAMLAYAGETGDLESRAKAVFAIERGNALASMPLEQLNNPDVIFTKSSWKEMDDATTGSGSLLYSAEIREVLADANVYCPDMAYIKHVEANYTESNLGALKDFAILNVLGTFGGFLGDDIAELNKELQVAMLGSAVETPSLEYRAQMLVTNLMSSAFSKLYADTYVSPAVKDDVTQIVELVRDKFRERINNLEWMSDETKRMAIEKLDAIRAFIAYPDSYSSGYSFNVTAKADGGNLIDFYIDYAKTVFAQQIEVVKKPYEVDLWDSIPTYTVNAFYSPTENAIIVPAGILQEPFYTRDTLRETNLGSIGAVIAHEITHAFDNNGAKYDKNGTITNWWADADYAAFGALSDQVATALSKIQFVGEQTVNGPLCTGETIADLGALACALDIADDIFGADMAAVMRSWTTIWASKMSPEVAAYLLAVDVHAPHKVRANFALSHSNDFHGVFSITEGDGMYVAPEDRITIW
jgi:putative endopeptidase